MKKLLLTALLVMTFFACSAVSASAGVVNNIIKVGLSYADTARFSADLENKVGAGFDFGYYDDERNFHTVADTGETAIAVTAAGDIYMSADGTYSAYPGVGTFVQLGSWHVQTQPFASYEEALAVANGMSGYPAWIDGEYVVRIGFYASQMEAAEHAAMMGGSVVQSSASGVLVTVAKSERVIFEFDCGGVLSLGVQPNGQGSQPLTSYNGYHYPGGFEYPRTAEGILHVYNVVDLEDYIKGVVPYEMNRNWPLAALEAQAICARTFACGRTRHYKAYGFDVCSGVDCQVYYGFTSGSNGPNERTNAAVDNTAGMLLYHDGEVIRSAVYHASNGGATENVENVWSSELGYLRGKEDPYEAMTNLPSSYKNWTVTYTAEEIRSILELKEYPVGTVKNVYISEYTPTGNVKEVTIEGSAMTRTFSGESARTIFYSSAMGKSVKSMRFSINGSSPASSSNKVYINDSRTTLDQLSGVTVLSGGGTKHVLNGSSFTVLTASGTETVKSGGSTTASGGTANNRGVFVFTGSGSGHNLGLSQYGAKAMAEQGYSCLDILNFYYTDVTVG